MISELPNIDTFISKDKYDAIYFNTLKATFSSGSKENIIKLESVLRSDNISFVTKREYLWKWTLKMEITITDKFNEATYQKIIGKFFLLASRSIVNLESIGLSG